MTTNTVPEANQEAPKQPPLLPKCKGCQSTEIISDQLACQSMLTREFLVMPIFICKNCSAGLILADNFKPFVTKVLEKLAPKPPMSNEEKKDSPAAPVS